MPHWICTTCGTQYAESVHPLEVCLLCNDERQYVRKAGQQWTTLQQLRQTNRNSMKFEEPGLIGIGIEPQFAIGQRAFFLQTLHGNILWDCVSLLDEAIVQAIKACGGLKAIAISHPHYYSNAVDWSRAFGDAPIYLHFADQEWVMRPDPAIEFWSGNTHSLMPGVTLIHCGGHFAGGTVLHWNDGAAGKGALLSGDIIQVVADRKYVSFMYSYPNHIPLSSRIVQRIVAAVNSHQYERIYGAFWDAIVEQDGMAAVQASADRYISAIRDEFSSGE